jgi:hypothetical protein
MQSIYKAYFLKQFRILVANKTISLKNQQDIAKTIHQIGFKKWNVYAKPPFGGALQVLQYLGRYTHKVAITAHRILSIDTVNRTISFKYKDYRLRKSNQIHKELTLPITEFNRRFEQHILPKGFVKIRHYGYLKNYQRKQRLLEIFSQMKLPPPPPKIKIPIRVRILEKTGADITKCPKCKHGVLETVVTYRNGYLCAAYQSTNKYEPTLVMNNKASP